MSSSSSLLFPTDMLSLIGDNNLPYEHFPFSITSVISNSDSNEEPLSLDATFNQEVGELKRENEKLQSEVKKARKILKSLCEKLTHLHTNMVNEQQLNLEIKRNNEHTIKMLESLNYDLNEQKLKLEDENAQLRAFKNEFVNKAKSLDNTKNKTKSIRLNQELINQIESNEQSSIDDCEQEEHSTNKNNTNITNNTKKLKKKGAKKFNFPSKTVDYLIENYNRNKFPDNAEIRAISSQIKLTPQQVNKWFRDRRHKLEETKPFKYPSNVIDYLTKMYILNKFPSELELQEMGKETNLKTHQVKAWYYYRRKKDSKKV